jgi:hypothetical protein
MARRYQIVGIHCVKVRKTPITAEYAFQLLGRST